MTISQTCFFAAAFAAGLTMVCPAYAESDAVVEAETQAKTAAEAGSVRGQIRLPAPGNEGDDTNGFAMADVVVRVVGKLDLSRYPTPENWEKMSRDEQMQWAKAFRETEEYRELVRRNKEAQEARIVMTTGVDEDGAFSFEGLTLNSYKVQALIKRPDAGDKFSRSVSLAYQEMIFTVQETDLTVDLGEIKLEATASLSPGDLAPAWTATAYDGSKVSLSDFRGKFVLVDFWATWCGPCKAEVPNLEAVYADFGGEKFEIVGLSLDATFDLPKNYHEKKPSPYTNLYLGKWKEETTTRDYGIHGIPSIWLIGPDGKIVARDLRGKALREAVRAAIESAEEDEAAAKTEVKPH